LVAIPGDFNPAVKPLGLALESKDSLLGEKEIGQIKELLPKVRTRITLYLKATNLWAKGVSSEV
jgi:hypothetical protein